MKRAILLVFDSFGIGASLDAPRFGDEGADTFGHIVQKAAEGLADNEQREGSLKIPHLTRMGLAAASLASTGIRHKGLDYDKAITASFGYAVEQSSGKDTPSGHWEMTGLPVEFDWGYLTSGKLPENLYRALLKDCKLTGILGNCHASGTEIIQQFGEEHLKTQAPIIYTSGDSVLQIAAHEKYFDLDRLYDICHIARKLADPYRIARVIARPFIGERKETFVRTSNRRDYAIPPHDNTLLDHVLNAKGEVIAIGKISDIFAGQGISQTIKGKDNLDLFDKTLEAIQEAPDRSLIFTNFVDFDSLYGHRRDVAGYAAALEAIDQRLPELEALLQKGDLAIITADHGCDPTFTGFDHTREHVPILAFGPLHDQAHFIGRRDSFADVGQTIAQHLGLSPLKYGLSFLSTRI